MDVQLSPAVLTPETQQGGKTKLNSCTLCQQRKVKCDKRQPTCTACATHSASCIYVAPAKSQRKRKRSPDEELLSRLNRYESLLGRHGIPLDGLDSTSPAIPNNSLPKPSPILTAYQSCQKDLSSQSKWFRLGRMEVMIVHSSHLESLLQIVGSKASLRMVCGTV